MANSIKKKTTVQIKVSYNNRISHSRLHSNEHLITAFFITVLLHSTIIFGISFGIPSPKKAQTNQTLDIVLVKTKAEKAPEDPDFLAQADQKGGGELKDKAKPTSKNPGETPSEGNALQNKPKTTPLPVPEVVEKKSILSTPKPSKIKAQKLVRKKPPKPKKSPDLLSDSIAELQQQIIDKEAMLDKQTKLYAKSPKATYITASTRRATDAMYLLSWTKKIERIGNLNYPDKARRDKLEGQLILAVTIAPEGHILNIRISKSSGHKVLDDAAKRIVELAAPYAAVPKEVLQGNNRLVITRTWQFSHSSGTRFSYK
ncbi:MAG: energy transducer TonB [gamma proteobacterium symbiont of Bathyaustriella thionipta]|nr:energy transducer TonB [gamma proteobacterium symbiont of Bathyaustriella thionipta]MCU7949897.1 energy transducer TonB [gamma proteobacterium symbiont of Bathyaustriella thionipta]MCU7954069.1 energy transducer TonB [gamma proteobacterium symbiont of Bathyaustriella thionipta]MCU7956494.1 energy transducer TonB [gamma proteobacterium symbiont of Bathyaustriella thionipta]MCU7968564.1 energy transducer TonB [gamma proteobacterium symbiont of Bathyaustriella thionipta]